MEAVLEVLARYLPNQSLEVKAEDECCSRIREIWQAENTQTPASLLYVFLTMHFAIDVADHCYGYSRQSDRHEQGCDETSVPGRIPIRGDAR
jgi:hypothetical protein